MLKRIIKRIKKKKKKKSENDVYDQEETCIDSKPAAPATSEVQKPFSLFFPQVVTSPNIDTQALSEVHFVYKGINKKSP